MPRVIIEICPNEPRASACLKDGREISEDKEVCAAFRDCVASGDCEPACDYVRDAIGVEFRTIARDETGAYVNRLATREEMRAACNAIYFESTTDFADEDTAANYLIWEAASAFDCGA